MRAVAGPWRHACSFPCNPLCPPELLCSPRTYCSLRRWASLRQIERNYRDMIRSARDKGYDVAADNLQHRLDAGGADRVLDVTWLRGNSAVTGAERVNQGRFEKQLKEHAGLSLLRRTGTHQITARLHDHAQDPAPAVDLVVAPPSAITRA